VLSKWEWVGKKLEELGYIDLAAKAKEIETVLKCLYNNTITKEWKEDYNDVERRYKFQGLLVDKLAYIESVARVGDYCIACKESEERKECEEYARYIPVCELCKFGALAGMCDRNSLFKRFRGALVRTMKEKEVNTNAC